MSYDLHITKATDWPQSSLLPITECEWQDAVANDAQLRLETTLIAVNPKTGESIQINNPLMASWTDPASGEKHFFYYSCGEVTVNNPSESAIQKMKSVASALAARVQGDEGEWY